MDTTRAQLKALDDELVTPANHIKIGKCNLRLSSNLNSKEPTLQVVLDALKLTSFYKAFEITVDVPEIYMQELWVTVSRHHSLLRFKINGKSHTVNDDNFKDMLQICPKLPGQKFEDPPLEEEILSFIKEIGHTGEIKDTQVYGALLSLHLTNQAMLESEAYKTYHAYATGKRLKATANMPKSGKKKPPAQGLETLSEITLSETEQIKIATKRSKIQFYSSHASGSGADKGTGVSPGVPNTELDNDGDDFLHPELSTFDKEERHDENQDEEGEGSDLRVQTPSHFESINDEAYDDVTQGVNVEEEKLDEDKTNEEEEVNELYIDVNINLEG
nr:hypothetical protein [Tanacetum cinerariifolium]GFA40943.1 hypothetical protein [Tanacetum cinerariifolium]